MRVTVDTFLESLGFSGEIKKDRARGLVRSFLSFLAYLPEGAGIEVDGVRFRRLDSSLFQLEGVNEKGERPLLLEVLEALPNSKLVKVV